MQYLAVKQEKKDIYANAFLYKSLIETAENAGFTYLSFGISTEDGGRSEYEHADSSNGAVSIALFDWY